MNMSADIVNIFLMMIDHDFYMFSKTCQISLKTKCVIFCGVTGKFDPNSWIQYGILHLARHTHLHTTATILIELALNLVLDLQELLLDNMML